MSETTMPAAEASAYELAFHVLPTVAEGEVAVVFQKLKDLITKHGGTITIEEAPIRFDLAYEIVKYLEGRNRKFSSAYFGWIRFTIAPTEIAVITEEVEGTKELLRHLLIKLTRVEEAYPVFFHDALEILSEKTETIDIDAEEGEMVGDVEVVEEAVAAVTVEDGEESTDKV
jgi:ribosomal protein S6